MFNAPLYNQTNPLVDYLRQYFPQQTETATPDTKQAQNTAPYEITSQSELEYIEPDTSGQRKIVYCPNENKVYIGRYSHAKKITDWRSYIDEGEIKLTQQNDTSTEIGQIAKALVAVVDKLEAMHGEIQSLKNIPREAMIDSDRRPNGQFKRKGE